MHKSIVTIHRDFYIYNTNYDMNASYLLCFTQNLYLYPFIIITKRNCISTELPVVFKS